MHWFEPLSSWVVSRYEDCHSVLRNPAIFRAPDGLTGIQSLDPPDSSGYRSHIGSGLRAAQRLELETDLVSTATDLVRRAPDGVFDLVRHFILPYCLTAVTRLVGQPEPEVNVLEIYTTAHQRVMDAGVLDPSLRESAQEEAARSRVLVGELISTWCASGSPGLISHLQAARVELGITPETELSTIKFLIFSTYGTGTAALGNGLVALLRRPGGIRELQHLAPAAWDTAIDELLRYDPPVQVLARTCACDTEIGGVRAEKGHGVLVLSGSANHDPAQFRDPEDVILTRAPNPHLGLGWGAHVCLGAGFTRLMFRAAFHALLASAPRLTLAGTPRRRPTSTSRAFDEIPVELDPSGRNTDR